MGYTTYYVDASGRVPPPRPTHSGKSIPFDASNPAFFRDFARFDGKGGFQQGSFRRKNFSRPPPAPAHSRTSGPQKNRPNRAAGRRRPPAAQNGLRRHSLPFRADTAGFRPTKKNMTPTNRKIRTCLKTGSDSPDMVRQMRLELTRHKTHAPQTCLSADSSTAASRRPLRYGGEEPPADLRKLLYHQTVWLSTGRAEKVRFSPATTHGRSGHRKFTRNTYRSIAILSTLRYHTDNAHTRGQARIHYTVRTQRRNTQWI